MKFVPRTASPRSLLALGLAAALALLLAPRLGAEEKSQLEVLDKPATTTAANACRILFIGDSITRHGSSPDAQARLGWKHVSGMAASKKENDYVHLLAAKIQARHPDRKVVILYDSQAPRRPLPPDAGQNLRSATVTSKLYHVEGMKTLRPHLVVIQLGEHDKEEVGEATLRENYRKLITAFDELTPRPQVICAGVWAPGDKAKGEGKYAAGHWVATIERVMRETCAEAGVPFASVREFALDPSCRGWGEHDGVRWHPNDKGMAGYASVLFDAYLALPPATP